MLDQYLQYNVIIYLSSEFKISVLCKSDATIFYINVLL